ncbi:MAG: CoA transferase [Deltaproteobacteria bacterium]|nr:CoA transferase [Deltaproteobacteria bacterium]
MAGPLNGLRILDFTTLLPGPFATMNLADLGADVLRIVSKSRPDPATFIPPLMPGTDISFTVPYLQRGKRCMTLNLKDSRATRIIHQLLCDEYDILIEQFRPGVMAKFGLDYKNLKKINPALIYCSITGYGQSGPLSRKAGHDINYLARSGLMSYSGRREDGPSLVGIQIADIASGSYNAIIGILSAVIYRNRTGIGQHIDISMTDGVMAFNILSGGAYLVDNIDPGREGTKLNGGSLYDFYETKDGQYISFGGIEPKFFAAFCQAIGLPDLIPGGVAPQNIEEAKQKIREIIKTRTRDEWAGVFDQTDACVEPVLSISEALNDPHTKERNMVVELDLPWGGKMRQLANPIKFSKTHQEYKRAGVPAGTHTKEVLRHLGYTDGEIDEFERKDVLN